MSDLRRRSYFGICAGGVCVRELRRRSYIGVCRGGFIVSDLCRRSSFGVCRGAFSGGVICVAAFLLAFAKVFVWVLCVVSV